MIAAIVALLTGADLLIKGAAKRLLAHGTQLDLGIVQLRLVYNPGVAFSLGQTLPSWLITAITALISLAIALYIWRTAAIQPRIAQVGLAVVLAGAIGNVVDRAGDGLVTDYLHTGWWPTFNLADIMISTGAALTLFTVIRRGPEGAKSRP